MDTFSDACLALSRFTDRSPAAPLNGLRVALTSRVDRLGGDPEVLEGLRIGVEALKSLGATVVELEAPTGEVGEQVNIIQSTELAHYHSTHAGRRALYSQWLREIVTKAQAEASLDDYLAVQVERIEHRALWERWFSEESIDLVIEPTVKIAGRRRNFTGVPPTGIGGEDPLAQYTLMWNYLGNPVATLPLLPHGPESMPVAVSLIGRSGADLSTIAAALALQRHELPALEVAVPVRASRIQVG